MEIISCRLAIEKNGILNVKLYLQKCLFNWSRH